MDFRQSLLMTILTFRVGAVSQIQTQLKLAEIVNTSGILLLGHT